MTDDLEKKPDDIVFRRDVITIGTLFERYANLKDISNAEATDVLVSLMLKHRPLLFYMSNSGTPQIAFNRNDEYSRAGEQLVEYWNSRWWDEKNFSHIDGYGLHQLGILWTDATELFGVKPDTSSVTEYSKLPMEIADLYDDPRWPEELGIALSAWRAAVNNAERETKRPGAYIRGWLKNHHPNLSEEANKRIATIANWDKAPGIAKG